MAIETFTFDKGINRRKNPLFLEEGELYSVSGFSYSHDGMLETRIAKTLGEAIDTTTTSTINGIHRYGDNIYASSHAYCPGNQVFFNYIYRRSTTGSYAVIDTMQNNTRPRFADYEKFTFVVDGESKRAYIDEHDYEWGIDNPTHGSSLTLVAPGNPNGTYNCYVTFLVGFPNDKWVETGPSPAAETTATNEAIHWSSIPICGYEGYGITIHRRLWRDVSGVIYLVATLTDNTTTTYTDDNLDGTLQLNEVMSSDEYIPPPTYPLDIAIYLQRAFVIKDTSLYWSEPYKPFSFLDGSDAVVTKDNENLVTLVDWSDQLWLCSSERWLRLQGSDPNTWSIKRTFADVGVVNKHTLKKSIYGIWGLWNDGIYLFDGSVSKNMTAKVLGEKFFTDLSDLSVCYAEWDTSRYYFYYASSGSTVDSCIVLDCTYFPDIRVYQDDFLAHAHELYKDTKHQYWAKSGYEYSDGGTEKIATSCVTGERGFGALIKRKCPDYLYYDIDTNNKDVTVDILADGVVNQTLTLNTNGRVRKRSNKLESKEGYRFSLEYTSPDSQDVIIYSPWVLEATPVGD